MSVYLRYQSAAPNRRGVYPGVFAMANGLATEKCLSPDDLSWWRAANQRATRLYIDPSTVVPDCYDTELNPGARSWYRESAHELLALTHSYLELLDRYGVRWTELRTSHPGRLTYEDDVQVVAVPLGYPDDWPFLPTGTRSHL